MYYLLYKRERQACANEGVKVALALAVSIFLWQFFQLPEGGWVMIASGFIYLGGSVQGITMRRVSQRIWGTALFSLAFLLFAGDFLFFDYRCVYFIAPVLFFSFYFCNFFGGYATYTFFFVAFLGFLAVITQGPSQELDLWNLVFARMLCTVLGALVVVVCEGLFAGSRDRSRLHFVPAVDDMLQRVAWRLRQLVAAYNAKEPACRDDWTGLFFSADEFISSVEMFEQMRYEPEGAFKSTEPWQEFFSRTLDTYNLARQLVFICDNAQEEPRAFAPAVLAGAVESVARTVEGITRGGEGETVELPRPDQLGEADALFADTLSELARTAGLARRAFQSATSGEAI